VLHELRTQGVISDLTKAEALLSVAQRYVITDSGWNLLDFAAQARDLTSANLIFHTLPIQGYATIDGQSANVVNPAYIKSLVQGTFYPKPGAQGAHHAPAARAPRTTVDVFNGGNTKGMAHRVSAALAKDGYRAGLVGNTDLRATTQVLYGAGASASAIKIAAMFGVTAAAGALVAPHHVQILLGVSATVPQVPRPAARTHAASRSPSVVIPTTGPQGGAVTATNGIPCVN
jgi:hypothetical protein